MASIAAGIGILAALLGVVGLLSPSTFRRIGASFRSTPALYGGVATRLLVGILLIVAGPYCRPEVPCVGVAVRVIGIVAIAVAVITMLLGPARLLAITEWWLRLGPAFLRGHALVVMLVGLFLIYAGT